MQESWSHKVRPYVMSAVASMCLSSLSLAQANSLDRTLDRLSASASAFSKSIPSFSCQEHIHSERRSTPASFGPRILPATMNAVSEIRVLRVDGRLKETRSWRLQDGRPVTSGQSVVPPYILNDAFGLPLPAYLDRAHRGCLSFYMIRGRINFQGSSMAGKGTCSDIAPQVTGFLIFDPATGLISHLERSVPVAAAAHGGFAPFASVDYAPFTPDNGDGSSYQLPTHIVATRQNQGYSLSFDAQYSDCKLFKATSTIQSTVQRPADEAPPHP